MIPWKQVNLVYQMGEICESELDLQMETSLRCNKIEGFLQHLRMWPLSLIGQTRVCSKTNELVKILAVKNTTI